MAEEKARNRLYDYNLNSNLVIDNRKKGRRDEKEPTGEAQSLAGRIDLRSMGDRVGRSAAPTVKKKEKKEYRQDPGMETRRLHDSDGVVGDNVVGSYKPKTKETKETFEQILAFILKYLGEQPRDIIHGAADEILAIIKNPERTAPSKHIECNKLLGYQLSEPTFAQLLRLCDNINDFSATLMDEENSEDLVQLSSLSSQDIGVAVVFDDDSDDESGSHVSEIDEPELSEDDDDTRQVRVASHAGDSDDSDQDLGKRNRRGIDSTSKNAQSTVDSLGNLPVSSIDAFWIQRELNKYYPDAKLSQSLAAEVLEILGDTDERSCENRLVMLLEFDKFDLIKVLLQNKKRLWFCTRLKKAQTEHEKQQILSEMEKDRSPNGGEEILELLENQGREESGKGSKSIAQEQRKRKIQVLDHDESVDQGHGYVVDQQDSFQPPTKLDLSSLTFGAGDHTMTNAKVKLPPGAWRKQHAGFEEVHIPPLKPKAFGDDESLIPISELPKFAQPAFSKMKSLNRVQSRIYPTAINEDCNLLICAPTGAGKTNVALLTVLHEVSKFVDATTGEVDTAKMKEGMKIVYIAPMKALVQEVVQNFTQRLTGPYGMVVRELSGDQQLSRSEITETQIIVTTPEKWDIVTRKAGERAYTQLVRLVIIDEIHLLHNERGAVLEAIVARIIRQQEITQQRVRIVGISATLPNYTDVAAFCRVPLKKGLFFFDNSFRPVPLQQQYVGITENKPLKRLQKSNEICFDKIRAALTNNSQDQILIFVHSRKETASSGRAVRDIADSQGLADILINSSKPETKEVLLSEAEGEVHSADLKELLPFGIGIHHAGMSRSDRLRVEDLFKAGYIKALFCTATLAWGVNLPAHTVIIKGTQVYNPEKGRWTEVSPLDILQMLGRAGRPQYDTEGEGIIITSHSELQYYLSLLNEQLPIESQLMRRFTDSLNAELVSGSVQSLQDAARWIGYTYLYVRMLRNPRQYGISVDEIEGDPTLFQRRINLAHSAALLLDKSQLVRYDKRSGYLQVTPLGRIASHYYVSYDTMLKFGEFLRPTMSDIDLFRVFSASKEFANLIVREEEKVELAQLVDRAPIPIKESMDEPSAKVNVLLQSFISGLRLEGYALACDLVFIHQNASRIVRALFEICLAHGWSAMAQRCQSMANMCDHRIWPSQLFLRQLHNTNLSPQLLMKLERHNFSVDQYFHLSPQELGELSGEGIKIGRLLHRTIHCFPKVDLSAHVQPITRSTVRIDLTITPDFEFDENLYLSSALPFWVIVEDSDGEMILHHELIVINSKNIHIEHETHFTVPLSSPLSPQYFCRVICDRFLHSSAVLPISFRKLVLPDRFMPPTELLDMRPLHTTQAVEEAYGDGLSTRFIQEAFDLLFVSRFDKFNAIQTQTFNALVQSEENVFIASPSGSGKTVCAELAMVRAFASSPSARCVYVAPLESVCKQKFVEWSRTFDAVLGKTTVMLTGDTTSDLRLVSKSSIIVSTPESWDNLSRLWKKRKAVREVSLFIADELHLVGSSQKPVMEVVVSRMRLIASSTKFTRILGLSVSIANGSDVGAWIGASKQSLFNFHPSARPNRLEIELRGFEVNHFGTRLLAMARPVFDAIMHHTNAGKRSSIVFVPSRRQAKVTAIDIITFAAARQVVAGAGVQGTKSEDTWSGKSLFVQPGHSEELSKAVTSIDDLTLQQTLEYGVAYIHENSSSNDRAVVEALFETGVVRVLIATSTICWGFRHTAHLVVVMDTTRYEGAMQGFVDYPIADVVQMVGRASSSDDIAKCVVLCHSKKKNFYKKFLHDPLPVESHLNLDLADHLCAEIVSGVVKNKQDAVDYLTWTLLYRRLTKNPNYYNLSGTDNETLSDFLSELIETTLAELEDSKCIFLDANEMDVSPVNLGMIASYYYIQCSTIKLFAANLRAQSKLKRVMDVLVSAEEFEEIPVRHKEDAALSAMAKHLPVALTEPDFMESRTKVHILLQLHFSRRPLTPDQKEDLDKVLGKAIPLLQAMVDILSSNSWLRPALAAMELSQMIVQARWNTDSPLLQVPHFDQAIVERCHAVGVKRVFDMEELDEEKLKTVLQLPDDKLQEAVEFYDRYPNVELRLNGPKGGQCEAGDAVRVGIRIERLEDEDEQDGEAEAESGKVYGSVYCPKFPQPKMEAYWVVIGDPNLNRLYSIKRTALGRSVDFALEFDAPKQVGPHQLKVYLMCDSIMGVDQVHNLDLEVRPSEDGDSDSDSGSSSSSSGDDEPSK